MPEAPEVTAIVVSYNHAQHVTDALDSIAGQTYPPAQIIVIDDASSDETQSVISAWAEATEHDVHLELNTENRGLCRNLNAALAQVSTPLFAYISADDRMRPDRFERQVEEWLSHGGSAAGVYSDAARIDDTGQRLSPDYSEMIGWADVPDRSGDIFDDLLGLNWIPAASVLLNTAAVVDAGGYDEELFYEDHDLWLRLARDGQLLCVEEPLVDVRELPSSLGHTTFQADNPRYLAARLRIMLKHFGASERADRYLHTQVPALAVKLWRAGHAPELVERALALTSRGTKTPGLTVRLALLRAGLKKEPRLLERFSG